MRLKRELDGATAHFEICLDRSDRVVSLPQSAGRLSLLTNHFYIQGPRLMRRAHPDLAALAAVLCVWPWVGDELELVGFDGVSHQFADALYDVSKVSISPVDDNLDVRRPGTATVLSYSSGADSIAASRLISSDSPLIHWRRMPNRRIPNRATHVRADAIERLVREAAHRGRRVEVFRGDFEYLTHPYPTLPNWFAIAVGSFLAADELNAGAVVLGGTLETYYMDMGRRWRGAQPPGLYRLSDAAGMLTLRPVLGLTEVATMNLARSSDLRDLSRSCVLGTLDSPCGACSKCVRKSLISAVLEGAKELPGPLRELAPSAPGITALGGALPLYMQAQFEFSLSRLALPPGPFADLHERLGAPTPEPTEWMYRHFPDSLPDGVPEYWRREVGERIARLVDPMTARDVEWATQFSR